ncbi:hypothetical protein MBLNU459_g6596t1 [Dothideomycetes sp. NU459]
MSKPKRFLWPASGSTFLKHDSYWKPVYDVWTTVDRDEILVAGSDDENEPDKHRAKRQRRERLACSYLAGKRLPFFMATSRGPFGKHANLAHAKNPREHHGDVVGTPIVPLDHAEARSHAPSHGPLQEDHVVLLDASSKGEAISSMPELPSAQHVPATCAQGRLNPARAALSGPGIMRRRRSPSIAQSNAPTSSDPVPANVTSPSGASASRRDQYRSSLQTSRSRIQPPASIFQRRERAYSRTPDPEPGDIFDRPSTSSALQATPSRPPRTSPAARSPRPAEGNLGPVSDAHMSSPQSQLPIAPESELTEFESGRSDSSVSAQSSLDAESMTTPHSLTSRAAEDPKSVGDSSLRPRSDAGVGITQTDKGGLHHSSLGNQNVVGASAIGHVLHTSKQAPALEGDAQEGRCEDDSALGVRCIPPHPQAGDATAVQQPPTDLNPGTILPSIGTPTWDVALPTGFTPINQRQSESATEYAEHCKSTSDANTLPKRLEQRPSSKTYQVAGPTDASPFIFRRTVPNPKTTRLATESNPGRAKKPKPRKLLFDSSMEVKHPDQGHAIQPTDEEATSIAKDVPGRISNEPNAVPAIQMSFTQESFGVNFDLIDRYTNSILPGTRTVSKRKSVSDSLRKAMRESGAAISGCVGDTDKTDVVNTVTSGSLPVCPYSPRPANVLSNASSHTSQDNAMEASNVIEEDPYMSTQAAMQAAHRALLDSSSPGQSSANISAAVYNVPAQIVQNSPVDAKRTSPAPNGVISAETQAPILSTQALLESYSPFLQSTTRKGRNRPSLLPFNSADDDDDNDAPSQSALPAPLRNSTDGQVMANLDLEPSNVDYDDLRNLSMSPDVVPPSQISGTQNSVKERGLSLQPPSGSVPLSEVFDSVSSLRGGKKLNPKVLLSQESSRQSSGEISTQSRKGRGISLPSRSSLRSSLRSQNSLPQKYGALPSLAPSVPLSQLSLTGSTTIADDVDDDVVDVVVVAPHQSLPFTVPGTRQEPSRTSQAASLVIVDEPFLDSHFRPPSTSGNADRENFLFTQSDTQPDSELTPLAPFGTRFDNTPDPNSQLAQVRDSSYQAAQALEQYDPELDATMAELEASVLAPWDNDAATSRLLDTSFG